MRRILPYPLLAASLLLMWLLLNGFTPGQFVLGSIIVLATSRTMLALEPDKPRFRRWWKLPWLALLVAGDIIRSNIAVVRLALFGRPAGSTPGFVELPLDLRDRNGLALLACIITTTPGTAWIEYRSRQNTVLIHVLDLKDEAEWIALIKRRYERLLMEIFE